MFKRYKEKTVVSDIKSIGQCMSDLYHKKLLPLETTYKFHELISPKLEDSDFTSAPLVMFVGQYSTGKTTFIRYLLNQNFPECRIGPEPTTDRFIAIMHGDNERSIPGNAAVVDPKKPFHVLSQFGNSFLNRFTCAEINNELLKNLTIIDTPGVLSGAKQTGMRGYDFINVMKTIGERCERIYLLFDAHKLDISDEFRAAIEALRHHDNKIRIILNKADRVDYQALMRVYGALMWSLGKIVQTPEVTRVFIGSFWEEPYLYDYFKKLFELEEMDLMSDMLRVPSSCMLRRLNDLIARSRYAVTLCHIISEISTSMPVFFKEKKKTEILNNLEGLFSQISVTYGIPRGDFPDIEAFKAKLQHLDFSKFPQIKKKLLDDVNSLLTVDVPQLMERVAKENMETQQNKTLTGGIFTSMEESKNPKEFNPFDARAESKMKLGFNSDAWVVECSRAVYDEQFERLGPVNGKIQGSVARVHLQKSNLSNLQLMKIWKLSDIDKDGCLDKDEFALCSYLIEIHLNGTEIPDSLGPGLVPPSKRDLVKQ